jgi:beta-lactamase class D
MRYIRHAFTFTKLKNKNLYTLKVSDYKNGKQLSWYIGYVEYINNTYIFVHCIESNSKKRNLYFETIQSELLHASLKELGILDDEMCGKL